MKSSKDLEKKKTILVIYLVEIVFTYQILTYSKTICDVHVGGFDFKHIKYMDHLKYNHLYIKHTEQKESIELNFLKN